MDESSLSSLSSQLTFTHGSIVKRVVCPVQSSSLDTTVQNDAESCDSYLTRMLRLLGREVKLIREMELRIDSTESSENVTLSQSGFERVGECKEESCSWGQYLAPQDISLTSCKVRRLGCLAFLRELFNMIRMDVQDKCEITKRIVHTKVKIDVKGQNVQKVGDESVNLLMLLGTVLSDPNSAISERIYCLEIISAIAFLDSSLIRNHCLQEFKAAGGDLEGNRSLGHKNRPVPRPQPNENRQVSAVRKNYNLTLSFKLKSFRNPRFHLCAHQMICYFLFFTF